MNAKEMSVTACGKSSLERPRYYPGLLLEDEDLTSAVDYTRNSLRLLMRSLFGCGIVCGLDVDAEFWCNKSQVKVTVRKGVAFDCEGNIIQVTEDRELYFDPKCEGLPPLLWVTIAYKERCCEQTTIACTEDDDGKTVPRRVVDGYEITVSKHAPQCACGCVTVPASPGASDGHKCCKQQVSQSNDSTAGNASGSEARLLGCDCYKAHKELVCGCGCTGDCSCAGLLLAYIKIDAASAALDVFDVKKRVPRVVRPMLLGAACCYADLCSQQSPAKYRAIRGDAHARIIDPVQDAQSAIALLRKRKEAMKSEKERLDIIRVERTARVARAQEQEQNAATPDQKTAAASELKTAREELAKLDAELLEFAKTEAEVDRDLVVTEKLADLRNREQKLAEEQAQLWFVDERIALAESQKLDTAPLKAQRTTIADRVKKAKDNLNA